MAFSEQIRKCVAFIGYPSIGGEFRVAGSVFFYGKEQGGHTNPTYLVTARHVIAAMKAKGVAHVVVRFNSKGGILQYLVTSIEDWFSHPSDQSVDIALLECGVPNVADHLVLPDTMAAETEQFSSLDIEPGAEILVTGLFSFHTGTERNIPIVRTGSLAAISEEKVPLSGYGSADAHLVEMHSTGGLSGSPVLAASSVRMVDSGRVLTPRYYLIGLMQGHWQDEVKAKSKHEFESKEVLAMVNTGIAMVVPVEKLNEMMELYRQNPRPRQSIGQPWSLEKFAP